MTGSLREILAHADVLGRRFEKQEPGDIRIAAPLRAVREAVTGRGDTERRVAQAVATARDAGVSWTAIASMLGTSGEAARKRYAEHHTTSASHTHACSTGRSHPKTRSRAGQRPPSDPHRTPGEPALSGSVHRGTIPVDGCVAALLSKS